MTEPIHRAGWNPKKPAVCGYVVQNDESGKFYNDADGTWIFNISAATLFQSREKAHAITRGHTNRIVVWVEWDVV